MSQTSYRQRRLGGKVIVRLADGTSIRVANPNNGIYEAKPAGIGDGPGSDYDGEPFYSTPEQLLGTAAWSGWRGEEYAPFYDRDGKRLP